MKTFLVLIRFCLVELGDLLLHSLEIESIAQAINHFVLLYLVDTLTRHLFKTMIEYVQLEVGITDFFLMRSFKDFKDLVMDLWLVSLWRSIEYYGIQIRVLDINLLMHR